MDRSAQIASRIKEISTKLGDATLIAVSKYCTFEDVLMAYRSGQREFGESRVQDLKLKSEELREKCREIKWHFIGKLQSNKVNNLLKIPNLEYIHSIDSVRLLMELVKKEHLYNGERLKLYLQVNTSGESEKSGFSSYDDLALAVKTIQSSNSSKYKLDGLMTIGKIRSEDFERDARECFIELRRLRDKLEMEFELRDLKLSMGMSGDYQIAIEEGSHFVRVGSSIFSEE